MFTGAFKPIQGTFALLFIHFFFFFFFFYFLFLILLISFSIDRIGGLRWRGLWVVESRRWPHISLDSHDL